MVVLLDSEVFAGDGSGDCVLDEAVVALEVFEVVGRLPADARHTAATMMLAQGVPARVAVEILGHSTINLTLGTYAHVIPELTRDAAEKMDQAFYE